MQPISTSSSLFALRIIPLPLSSLNQRLLDITWLSPTSLALLFSSHILILSFPSILSHTFSSIPIPPSYDKRILLPLLFLSPQFCLYTLQQTYISRLCSNNKLSGVTFTLDQHNKSYYTGPLMFHKTGESYLVGELYEGMSVKIKHLVKEEKEVEMRGVEGEKRQWFYGKLDEEGLVLERVMKMNKILVRNIENNVSYQLDLTGITTQLDIILRNSHLYILSPTLLLLGKISLSSHSFQLTLHNLLTKQSSTILTLLDFHSCSFIGLNKQSNTMCMLLVKGVGELRQAKLIWVGYKGGKVVWEHNVKDTKFRFQGRVGSFQNCYEWNKRVSGDLKRFVEVDGEKGVVQVWYRPELRKVVQYLIERSGLREKYGGELAKNVIKLMVDE